MNKKTSLVLSLCIILSILFVACSTQSKTSATTTSGASQPGQGTDANTALLPAAKLAIGTIKLEGTDQAVTTEQAAELLTLWQAYQSLSRSDTTAAVELEALVSQIEKAMTSEQTTAIDAMNLTQQSTMEALQSAGLNFGPQGGSAQATPGVDSKQFNRQMPQGGGYSSGGNSSGGRNAGGGPSGGMPSGGGGAMPGGGEVVIMGGDMGAITTPGASVQSQTSSVNPMVLRAVIQILEKKVQGGAQ
jgi:hypothetical protein